MLWCIFVNIHPYVKTMDKVYCYVLSRCFAISYHERKRYSMHSFWVQLHAARQSVLYRKLYCQRLWNFHIGIWWKLCEVCNWNKYTYTYACEHFPILKQSHQEVLWGGTGGTDKQKKELKILVHHAISNHLISWIFFVWIYLNTNKHPTIFFGVSWVS